MCAFRSGLLSDLAPFLQFLRSLPCLHHPNSALLAQSPHLPHPLMGSGSPLFHLCLGPGLPVPSSPSPPPRDIPIGPFPRVGQGTGVLSSASRSPLQPPSIPPETALQGSSAAQA
ncbi:unnamed protein product [Rangifer tarandus platyrhynchus]|uniref:Uncharacterized protein n=2 Tax=Rangifer tarandus platyrhynchus TaxID=3082113 RepID=A0ACB0EYG8_RANTA|nr:unnamed protein product [Rangifer tarandus platyrhynchus]CAI9705800.1 unnamed protein product [Rangifer tarandus platyrhynchus]